MSDVFSKIKRSWIMRQIRCKDTSPELIVRSLAHRQGYRFRLHYKKLPGKPDLVFPKRKKIIFVHGCFWHGHNCSRGERKPRTNADYWDNKITKNTERDTQNIEKLVDLGWKVLIIWECETKNIDKLTVKLHEFFES